MNSRTLLRDGVTLTAVAALYFLLAKGGLEFASIHPSATPIWPPTGFAIAAILLFGYRIAPAIFVGAFLANATTVGTLATSLAIGLGNTAECLLIGYLLNRWSGGVSTFDSPAKITRFILLCLFPTMISASVGAIALASASFADSGQLLQLWLTWWIGDLAGALVICPAIVLWWRYPRLYLSQSEWPETFAIYATACAVGLIAFSPLIPQTGLRAPLGFLAILPLLWAALRRSQRDTISVAVILCGFAIWGTLADSGPFARTTINESFLILLAFMISAAIPSLALSASMSVRRHVENELRLAHGLQSAHLRASQRLAKLGSWVWDVRVNKVTWSPGLFEIFGLGEKDFDGTFDSFLSRLHPEDREKIKQTVSDAFKAGEPFKYSERIVRPNGDVRHLATAGEVIRDEAGAARYMVGSCQDVTDLMNVETTLQSTEQAFQRMVNSVHDYALYMLDPRGNVVSWNAGAARIKNYTADEIIGQHFSRFYTDEDRERKEPARALYLAEHEGKYEAEAQRVRKGGERFWAHVVIDPVRDDDGRLVGFAKITRDITERKEAQIALERTREQLAQSQKMEAIGQLTGGIAHDFNNLLMIVTGYAQNLRRSLSDPKQLRAVDAIRSAAERGATLTRQLLTFSRRQALNPVLADLRVQVEAVQDMLMRTLPGHVTLEMDIAPDLWPVTVDVGELELALVNVAVNARDAMPTGGRITISASNRTITARNVDKLQGDFVAVTVNDTGAGIPPDVLARVFEPFFTTKATGKGTGLGLSQVYGFAHQAGGAVTIQSEVGRGTTVTILMPRSSGIPSHVPASHTTDQHTAISARILLVEDNAGVAAVTMAMLEQAGCRVIHVTNATDALSTLQLSVSDFDLVLSDIVMPGGMDGVQLGYKIQAQYPDLPVLLISGYSDAIPSAAASFRILRKPFDANNLTRAVHDRLNSGLSRTAESAAG